MMPDTGGDAAIDAGDASPEASSPGCATDAGYWFQLFGSDASAVFDAGCGDAGGPPSATFGPCGEDLQCVIVSACSSGADAGVELRTVPRVLPPPGSYPGSLTHDVDRMSQQ